jgi:ATP-dependent Clp protease ATP-binding subunit ClpC
MTSNIGARFIQKKASLGFQASDTGVIDKNVNDMVLGEVKRTFNPSSSTASTRSSSSRR